LILTYKNDLKTSKNSLKLIFSFKNKVLCNVKQGLSDKFPSIKDYVVMKITSEGLKNNLLLILREGKNKTQKHHHQFAAIPC
jgi:hypothetical protein